MTITELVARPIHLEQEANRWQIQPSNWQLPPAAEPHKELPVTPDSDQQNINSDQLFLFLSNVAHEEIDQENAPQLIKQIEKMDDEDFTEQFAEIQAVVNGTLIKLYDSQVEGKKIDEEHLAQLETEQSLIRRLATTPDTKGSFLDSARQLLTGSADSQGPETNKDTPNTETQEPMFIPTNSHFAMNIPIAVSLLASDTVAIVRTEEEMGLKPRPEQQEQQIQQEHFIVPFYQAKPSEMQNILESQPRDPNGDKARVDVDITRNDQGHLQPGIDLVKTGENQGSPLWALSQSLVNQSENFAAHQVGTEFTAEQIFKLGYAYKKDANGEILDDKVSVFLVAQEDFHIDGEMNRDISKGDMVFINLETGTIHFIDKSKTVDNSHIELIELDQELIDAIAQNEAHIPGITTNGFQVGDVIPAELDANGKIIQIITQDAALIFTRQQIKGKVAVHVRTEPSTQNNQPVGQVDNQLLANNTDLISIQASTPEAKLENGLVMVSNEGLNWVATVTPDGGFNWVSWNNVIESGIETKTVAIGPVVEKDNIFEHVENLPYSITEREGTPSVLEFEDNNGNLWAVNIDESLFNNVRIKSFDRDAFMARLDRVGLELNHDVSVTFYDLREKWEEGKYPEWMIRSRTKIGGTTTQIVVSGQDEKGNYIYEVYWSRIHIDSFGAEDKQFLSGLVSTYSIIPVYTEHFQTNVIAMGDILTDPNRHPNSVAQTGGIVDAQQDIMVEVNGLTQDLLIPLNEWRREHDMPELYPADYSNISEDE